MKKVKFKKIYPLEKKSLNDIYDVLDYFNSGLHDIEAGSGEKQPMHKELKSVLKRVMILSRK